MDLNSVEAVTIPTRRDDLWPMHAGDVVLAGGTWLFSEPQPQARRLVDLTGLAWNPVSLSDKGIDLAATCTIAQVFALSDDLSDSRPEWPAAPLFQQCCQALLASPKVWSRATVGGNICLSLPAGAMISLCTALDGVVTVWRGDSADYRMPVTEFITGVGTNAMAPGDVLRSVQLPASALRGRTAYRKLAPAPLGRSGVVVIARRDQPRDGGRFVLSVTAATQRPYVFEFSSTPDTEALRTAHATIPNSEWTRDSHGDPDWRRAMTLMLADEVRRELA